MRNKLFLLGAFVGMAASVPLLYQNNPAAFDALLHSALGDAPAKTASIEAETVTPAPAPQPPAQEVLLGKKVRLSADQSGHFAGDFRLNGTTVPGMVDTGATFVAINSSTARRIGIGLSRSDFKYRVSTANGVAMAAATTIDDLQIGRIHIGQVDAVVLEDGALNNTLIGMSFLKRLSKYQVEDGSLILQQ